MIGDTKTPNQPELTGVFDGTAIKKGCTASIQPFGSGKEHSIAPLPPVFRKQEAQ